MQRLALIIGPVLSLVLIAGAVWYFWPESGADGPYGALKSRDGLNVGIRTDAQPFSYLDASGEFLGFEPELARDLAGELGLKLTLVPVDATTAVGFIERGLVDFTILPLPGLTEDQPGIHLIEPGYYASGLTVVTRRGAPLKSWEGLSGRTACGVTGDRGAAPVVTEFGGRFIGFSDVRTALQALAAERCDAVVEDETAVSDALGRVGREGFVRPLATIDIVPWRVALSPGEEALAEFIRETLVSWHLSGHLLDRAEAWDLPKSHYLVETKDYLNQPAIN